jgi:hypothetical protein
MFVAVLHENIEIAEETSSKKLAMNRNSVQALSKRGRLHWVIDHTPLKFFLAEDSSVHRSSDSVPPILGSSKNAHDFSQKALENQPAMVRFEIDGRVH